jgi:hypothetical protein
MGTARITLWKEHVRAALHGDVSLACALASVLSRKLAA